MPGLVEQYASLELYNELVPGIELDEVNDALRELLEKAAQAQEALAAEKQPQSCSWQWWVEGDGVEGVFGRGYRTCSEDDPVSFASLLRPRCRSSIKIVER